MKKILLFELCLLLLATNFQSDNPPGWYQQTLPVNDFVNDIFFIDTLTGWVVTQGHTNDNDTGYIMKTTNGGDNWTVQYARNVNLTTVQFVDQQTGYAGGGSGTGTIFMYKTTNGGNNWLEILGTTAGTVVDDIHFLNADTGWFCDNSSFDGGLYKTTNGGMNWVQQMNNSYFPQKISFINKDTGWVGSSGANGKLYRTTNGGINWQLLYTSNISITSLFFINGQKGWLRGGTGNGVMYTTNGGFNWISSQGSIATGFDTKFINDTLGYSGTYHGTVGSLKIMKSTDGGITWGYQITPILSANNIAILPGDTSNVWAGHIMHTTDGGGPIIYTNIQQLSTELPTKFKLYQNYPNPFNPSTSVRFKIQSSKNIKLTVFDITGKEIAALVNEKLSPGEYEYEFDAGNLPSGVYFYSLFANGLRVDTKKMLLVK